LVNLGNGSGERGREIGREREIQRERERGREREKQRERDGSSAIERERQRGGSVVYWGGEQYSRLLAQISGRVA
jgi:hypothetical protein